MVTLGVLSPSCIATQGYGCDLVPFFTPAEVHEICLASPVTLEFFAISPIYPAIVEVSWVERQALLESMMSICVALRSLIVPEIELSSPIDQTGTTNVELSSPIALEVTLQSPVPSACK
jgi:hypothetical protein